MYIYSKITFSLDKKFIVAEDVKSPEFRVEVREFGLGVSREYRVADPASKDDMSFLSVQVNISMQCIPNLTLFIHRIQPCTN